MSEMHLRQPRFTYSAFGPLFSKKFKSLKKQKVKGIYTKAI